MYTSTVSLAPVLPEGVEDQGVYGGLFKYCNQRFRTIAWSIDDALNLVNGEDASPLSKVEIWNAQTRTPNELKRVLAGAPNISWMNYPTTSKPFTTDLRDTLPQNGEWLKRSLEEVYLLTIHHSVGWNAAVSNEHNAINIANFHINSRDWVSAGYHFLIAPDGEIMELNHLEEKTYHAGSYDDPLDENKVSIGICLGGDFRYNPPSEPQIFSAAAVVAWLQRFLITDVQVLPHQRMPGASNQCPGEEIDDWMRRISGNDPII